MTELVLKAEAREGLGKEANKKLRRTGIAPAVFYQKQKAQALQVNVREFVKLLKAGEQLIDISIDGKKKKALIKAIQYHPVTEAIVHIDFQGVSMSEVVQVSVHLNFEGTSKGVREGGQVEVAMHEIEIKCKASDIPTKLDVNIEALNIGDNLHVSDLNFDGLEIVSSDELLVVSVVAPKVFKDSELDESAEEAEEEASEEGSEE